MHGPVSDENPGRGSSVLQPDSSRQTADGPEVHNGDLLLAFASCPFPFLLRLHAVHCENRKRYQSTSKAHAKVLQNL